MLSKFIYTLICTLFLSGSVTAQIYPLPVGKVDSTMVQDAKPLLILLSTDWCKYCQMQKNQLQKNTDFQNGADHFYYIEFDAESKENTTFHQQNFAFNPTFKTHELAIALNGSHKMSYPTWVLLNTDYQVLFRHNGVLLPKQIQELLSVIEKANTKK